jgi:uracil-DNA glycosylase family 4
MEKIAGQIKACVQCPLWKKRKSAVPGEGNIEAGVVFVGEAPGSWEDVKGLPFVGAAGKVLDGLLESIGLPRESVFITNVVKCRPPKNRDPKPVEVETCTSLYLKPQVHLIKPKVVVTLGRHSTSFVFSEAGIGKIKSITELRGKIRKIKFLDMPMLLLPMYHPASVLHNPRYREALESDFQLLKNELKRRRIV